jgi:hypothetical protein
MTRSHLDPKSIEAKASEYIGQQENFEPEVRERALAAVKDQQQGFRKLLKILARLPKWLQEEQPSIFSDPVSFKLTPDVLEYAGPVLEQFMQALIYGNRDHFMGLKDAFSFGHEYAHIIAKGFDSGKTLETVAYDSQLALGTVAVLEDLSAEQIDELWERFETTRERINDIVEKFEPIEEIFATYVGLRFLPVDVRNNVEPLVKEKLRERNWDKVYDFFAKLCDHSEEPQGAALSISEIACLVLLHVDVDALVLLRTFLNIHCVIWSNIYKTLGIIEQKDANAPDRFGWEDAFELEALAESEAAEKINLLLDDAHIPRELYWSASQALRARRKDRMMLLSEAIRDNDVAELGHRLNGCAPKIRMIGSLEKKFISFCIETCKHVETEENKLPYLEIIFYESLAEQLLHNKWLQRESASGDERAGHSPNSSFVCPFGSRENRKECCGRWEKFEMLYKRLPEKYRKHMTLPKCVRVG